MSDLSNISSASFTQMLAIGGEAITVASLTATVAYDTATMRPLQTATQWTSATEYTAMVDPLGGDVRARGFRAYMAQAGYKEQDGITAYLRASVAVRENDRIVFNGKTYIAKIVPPAEITFREVVAFRTEGQDGT